MPCPIPIRCGFAPNLAAPRYILLLLTKVISVSLETVAIVGGCRRWGTGSRRCRRKTNCLQFLDGLAFDDKIVLRLMWTLIETKSLCISKK